MKGFQSADVITESGEVRSEAMKCCFSGELTGVSAGNRTVEFPDKLTLRVCVALHFEGCFCIKKKKKLLQSKHKHLLKN